MQPFQPDLSSAEPDIDPQERIALNPDQRAVARKHLQEMLFAMGILHKSLEGEGLPNLALSTAALRATEMHFVHACKQLGIATQTQEEVDKRHADLRRANLRARALEAELASANTQHMGLGLKGLESRLEHWWDVHGFGYIREFTFRSYGCKAKLSGALHGRFSSSMSDTPVSDQQSEQDWHAQLQQAGFVLGSEGGRRDDTFIVDCDASRRALDKMLQKTLPSCEIQKIISRRTRSADASLALSDIHVLIRDLDEIAALPDRPRSTQQ